MRKEKKEGSGESKQDEQTDPSTSSRVSEGDGYVRLQGGSLQHVKYPNKKLQRKGQST